MKFRENLKSKFITEPQEKFKNFKAAIEWIEKDLSKKNIQKVGLMVDIDGVLVRLFQKKIPFENLKILLNFARKENYKVALVTNRFPYLTKYFPFLDKKTQEMFKNHKIDIEFLMKFLAYKNLSNLLRIIKNNEVVYYIGSGILDKKLVNDLRKKMKKENIPQEKLVFILV